MQEEHTTIDMQEHTTIESFYGVFTHAQLQPQARY